MPLLLEAPILSVMSVKPNFGHLDLRLDLLDLNLCVRLSVTGLLLLVLLSLVLENVDLLALAVLNDLSSYRSTFNCRSSYLEAVFIG